MFGSTKFGAGTYARVGIETGVTAASPHKLILMLYDGAMTSIASAIQRMNSRDIAGKGEAISKAISIITEGLRASLNKDAGGEIAENLDALYSYMVQRLLEANLKNKPEYLEEVRRLLGEIKGAWEEIAKNEPAQAEPIPAQANGYNPLMPSKQNLVRA